VGRTLGAEEPGFLGLVSMGLIALRTFRAVGEIGEKSCKRFQFRVREVATDPPFCANC
jgi:hypothetical protein